MAVKASCEITLYSNVDITGVYRYYKLQSSTASAPAKPTTTPASVPSGWSKVEPSYTEGSTNSLYFVDGTLFSNGSFSYSEVSLSSSYEAAKEAYNKAVEALNNAVRNEQKIAGWCAENNTVLIDGSKIYAGSVGARQIDVDSLVATAAFINAISTNELVVNGDEFANTYREQMEGLSLSLQFDGNDGLVISHKKSGFRIRITNEKISFLKNSTELGFWDGENLQTGNMYVKTDECARFGDFAFMPKSSGLLFKKII